MVLVEDGGNSLCCGGNNNGGGMAVVVVMVCRPRWDGGDEVSPDSPGSHP